MLVVYCYAVFTLVMKMRSERMAAFSEQSLQQENCSVLSTSGDKRLLQGRQWACIKICERKAKNMQLHACLAWKDVQRIGLYFISNNCIHAIHHRDCFLSLALVYCVCKDVELVCHSKKKIRQKLSASQPSCCSVLEWVLLCCAIVCSLKESNWIRPRPPYYLIESQCIRIFIKFHQISRSAYHFLCCTTYTVTVVI